MVVVGGGISGLTACYYLQESGKRSGLNLHLTLIEAGARLGGKVLTDRINGFVIEAGPDSFFTQKPWALDLCKELGLSERLVKANQETKGTFILNKGKLSKLPEGTETGTPANIRPFISTDLISPLGKLRALMDFIVPRRKEKEDESVADFFNRRFGKEFLEKIAEPLFAGIYAGDVNYLSMKAVLPRFAELESAHGSLIRSISRARKKMKQSSQPGAVPAFFTLKDGLAELIDTLISHLDNTTILLNKSVTRLLPRDLENKSRLGLVLDDGKEMRPYAIVLTTPAYVTEKLVRYIDEETAKLLAMIPYVSTATVSLAFRENELGTKLEGHGFLVPRNASEIVTGCTWSSSKWPGHSPSGTILVRCFCGWAGHEDFFQLDDVALVKKVREFLSRIAHISGTPMLVKVYRMKQALPQYNVGHLGCILELEEKLRNDGLFVTGAAYHGVGLPDCVHDAELTAQKIVKELIESNK